MTSADPQVTAATAATARARREIAEAPLSQRAGWLEALADILDDHAGELVALADSETHLGGDRLTGELARTSAQLRLFARVVLEGSFLEAIIDHPDPSATPPIPDLRRMLVPIGSVAVFAASNFPFAFSVLGGDTASALAAGCPVVVKAHEGHLRLSRRVADLAVAALEAAGAPSGSLELIVGREAGLDLVRAPEISAVGFTGSVAGGRHLFDVAAQRPDPIPFYGELGSINPVVLTAGVIAESLPEVTAGLAGSFTLGVGQFCTKPGVVFAPEGSDLAQKLVEGVDPTPRPMLNERIGESFRERLGALAGREGVEVLSGLGDTGPDQAAPVVLRTSVPEVLRAPEAVLDEVFGPAVLIVEYASIDDLRQALAVLPGSLTATLHATRAEQEVSAELIGRLTSVAGRVIYGGWPTGVAVSHAQHHGGPYPATTSVHTSVGTTAIRRWLRPVAYQTTPDELLPPVLQEANPWGVPRRVDGRLRLPGQDD